MFSNNRNILIIVLAVLVILLLLFVLEWRDVPIVKNWDETYNYELTDPYGSSALKEALSLSFGEDNISLFRDIDSLHQYTNSLYINIGYNIYLSENKSSQLREFMDNGNDVLFISQFVESEDYDLSDDSYVFNSIIDSTTQVIFTESDSSSYTFTYRGRSTSTLQSKSTPLFEDEILEDSSYHALAIVDSLIIYYRKDVGLGSIHRYSQPYHFCNLASLQSDFKPFYNEVFGQYDVEQIILDRPQLADRIESDLQDSPLKYILAQASLRWAYYLTLFTALLYILFKGKRKQKIIPIRNKPTNTSLEYVDTLSQLFLSQKQNSKLIEHMEDQFYHKVLKKYFIDKNNLQFNQLLHRKSKVELKEIEKITNSFSQATNGYSFSDDQLHRLYNNLNHFYTNWK